MGTKTAIRMLAAVLLVVASQRAMGQQTVGRWLISGGGTGMTNSAYGLTGSVGQPVVGGTSGKTNAVWQGFWRTFGTGIPTAVRPVETLLPERFGLAQNYPNPFNPATAIHYAVAAPSLSRGDRGAVGSGEWEMVSLKVYDVLGREVATLVNGEVSPGEHMVTWNAVNMPSGVYYCRLTLGSIAAVRKMVLLK
jgi:hypothetical protein